MYLHIFTLSASRLSTWFDYTISLYLIHSCVSVECLVLYFWYTILFYGEYKLIFEISFCFVYLKRLKTLIEGVFDLGREIIYFYFVTSRKRYQKKKKYEKLWMN